MMAGLSSLAQPQRLSAQRRGLSRIGWITAQQPASLAAFLNAFRAGLAELGYAEGQNIAIDDRYGEDDIGRVAQLAAELASFPVDVLVAQGVAVTIVSKLELPVPVIYVFSGDPVSAGFAESLTRPRANMTGLTFMAAQMNAKRLELLQSIIPDLRRVALIGNPGHPGEHLERAITEETGRRLGVTINSFPTRAAAELSDALKAIASDPPQGISVLADGFAIQNRQRIIDLATSLRIPVISGWPTFARSGALFSYGPRLQASYRRLSHYVDRVLKGAKPGDLPIEQPAEFELILNLIAARELGVSIPTTLLVQADEVIE